MKALAATLVLVCAVATACSGSPAGPVSPTFPPRPLDVMAATINPCGMLSPDQERSLGATDPERRSIRVGSLPSDACVWLTDTDLGYGVQTIPVDAATARSEPGASTIEVNGFGAVRSVVTETGGAPTCQVTVDAGPGQSIRVQAQATGERPRTDEEMCRIATDVTGMVMTTVVATARR